MEGVVKNQISEAGVFPEVDPIRSAVELTRWIDAAGTEELIDTVPAGYKYYITEVSVQNLGAATVVMLHDAATAAAATADLEGTYKYAFDVPATDTTVITGIMLVFEAGAVVSSTICAAAHDVKIHLSGKKVKA